MQPNTLSVRSRIAFVLLILSTALFSGCASYEKKELSRIESLPDLSHYHNKPSVYVDLRVYTGEPGTSAKEIAAAKEQLAPMVKKVFEESHAFSTISMDAAKPANSDYTVQVDIFNHGNQGAAFISGFLTGYTLGLIPGAATDNYTVRMKALDSQGELLKEHQNKDSVQTWLGVWFIPAMGNTPEKARDNTISNQIKLGLKEIIESKQMKYSRLQQQRDELALLARPH